MDGWTCTGQRRHHRESAGHRTQRHEPLTANNTRGTFTDVTSIPRAPDAAGFSASVAADYDNDGIPTIRQQISVPTSSTRTVRLRFVDVTERPCRRWNLCMRRAFGDTISDRHLDSVCSRLPDFQCAVTPELKTCETPRSRSTRLAGPIATRDPPTRSIATTATAHSRMSPRRPCVEQEPLFRRPSVFEDFDTMAGRTFLSEMTRTQISFTGTNTTALF